MVRETYARNHSLPTGRAESRGFDDGQPVEQVAKESELEDFAHDQSLPSCYCKLDAQEGKNDV